MQLVLAHGEVFSIQLDVIKFISGLRQTKNFSQGTPVTPTNKTESHDIILDIV
jgi:hypothetical protein